MLYLETCSFLFYYCFLSFSTEEDDDEEDEGDAEEGFIPHSLDKGKNFILAILFK